MTIRSGLICSLTILLLKCYLKLSLSQLNPSESPYSWNQKWKYYFPNLQLKLTEMMSPSCTSVIHPLPSKLITSLYMSQHNITAASISIPVKYEKFWKSIKAPLQMRVDPWLCDEPKLRLKPIFKNTGCIAPYGYMIQSAPRCQISYLQWICDNARSPINESKSNGFYIPESHHAKSFYPPIPYIIKIRDSFVMM